MEKKITKTRVMSEDTAYMMTNLLQSSAQYGLGNQYHIGAATALNKISRFILFILLNMSIFLHF